MKSVLLIQNAASSMGGVETLVARIAQNFIKKGIEVTVLILGNSAQSRVLNLIPDNCRVVFFPGLLYSKISYPIGYWNRQWQDILPGRCDLIMSFSPAGIAAMRFFRRAWFPRAKELVYVVHPKMLDPSFNEVPSYIESIVRTLPVRAFVFMNEACQSGNKVCFSDENLDAKSIFPVPVDPFPLQPLGFEAPRRLVSIGRIESGMKTYNWTFINDFCELAIKHNLIWEIYGSGTTEDIRCLSDAIAACSCRKVIKLCGEIPQSKIPEVLKGSFAFIGMGTALVQAASCGIPSVVAIGYHKASSCYGWFYQVPFPCVGEDLGEEFRTVPISDCVGKLASMEQGRVTEIGKRCREHALLFSADKFFNKVHEYFLKTSEFPVLSFNEILVFWYRYMVWRLRSKFKALLAD